MKLAEGLILRADYQKRVEQLKQRLLLNARVQEGDNPAENQQELIAELERIATDLTRLIQQINKTNVAVELEKGLTLADGLASRDILGLRHSFYRTLAQSATVTHDRYSRSEVKFQSTVDVAALQKQADELAQQHRELDTKIQAANWATDILE
jgi:hypothetical protein